MGTGALSSPSAAVTQYHRSDKLQTIHDSMLKGLGHSQSPSLKFLFLITVKMAISLNMGCWRNTQNAAGI